MKKILIADDAMFMRNALKVTLEKNGFEVIGTACDGREAVEKARALKPDLGTMDITMTELNGIEALKAIKETNPEISVIMLTAVSGDVAIRECLENGADNFILKPFSEDKLIEVISKE